MRAVTIKQEFTAESIAATTAATAAAASTVRARAGAGTIITEAGRATAGDTAAAVAAAAAEAGRAGGGAAARGSNSTADKEGWECKVETMKMKRQCKWLTFRPAHDDDFLISSDDGTLQMWKYSVVDKTARLALKLPNAIDLQDQPRRLSVEPVFNQLGEHLAVGHAVKDSSSKTVVSLFDINNKRTDVRTDMHAKGLSAVAWVPSANPKSHHLITAGADTDHSVVIWAHVYRKSAMQCEVVHQSHSASIMCMHVTPTLPHVITGGMDGRLISFSIEAEQEAWRLEMRQKGCPSKRFNAVRPLPNNPNLFLASTTETNHHCFFVVDRRDPRKASRDLQWEWTRHDNTKSFSRFVVPKVSPCSQYFSCGSDIGLNIWDFRSNKESTPVRSFVTRSKTLHGTWHPQSDAKTIFALNAPEKSFGLMHYRGW